MSAPLIVVLGAGRSAGWLIEQLQNRHQEGKIRLRIADAAPLTMPLVEGVEAQLLAVEEGTDFTGVLVGAFATVSLLPPPLHPLVMEACLKVGAHFLSASYESPAARELGAEAETRGLLILNECGLDPGLDHVTALAMLKRVADKGGKVLSFESDCGGLPAKADLNDWGYRFFWNPMNVVTAGMAGARFRQNGRDSMISTPEVFRQYRNLQEEDVRNLVAYANRDSLPYMKPYGLESIETFIRGTIRYQEFCDRWAVLAEAQVANTSLLIEKGTRYKGWVDLFGWHYAAHTMLQHLIVEAGLEEAEIGEEGTSAQMLLQVLLKLWNPGNGYRDRVLMRHHIVYEDGVGRHSYTGTLDIEGTEKHSAMAFTVGLPLAIMVDAILEKPLKGLKTPMDSDIWPMIYPRLVEYNIGLTYADLILA